MNKTYKVVWSQAQHQWTVVSETVRTKGKGARQTTVLAASAVLAAATGSANAADPSSYVNGVFPDSGFTNCFTSGADGAQAGGGACDSGGKTGAGFVAFDPIGSLGAYAVATDFSTLKFGTGGRDRLTIVTSSGSTTINAFATLNMNGAGITGLTDGNMSAGSTDAVNGGSSTPFQAA